MAIPGQQLTDANGLIVASATGLLTGYQNQLLVGNGLPVMVAAVNSTGLLVAQAATNLFSPVVAGLYLVALTMSVTTVGTAGTITTNVVYQDNDNLTAQTLVGTASGTITAKVVTSQIVILNSTPGATAQIQWSTTFTSVTGSPVYNVRGFVFRLT